MFSEVTRSKVTLSKPRMAESVMQVRIKAKSCKLVLNELPGPHCAMQRYPIQSIGNVIVCIVTAPCSIHVPCISFSSTNWSLETHFTGSKASQIQKVGFLFPLGIKNVAHIWSINRIRIFFPWEMSLSPQSLFKTHLASCASHKLFKTQIPVGTLFYSSRSLLSYCVYPYCEFSTFGPLLAGRLPGQTLQKDLG